MECLVVYADVIWLLNLCIDALLLMLTAAILKQKIKKWRLFAGAMIGSSIVIFSFTSLALLMTHPITKLMYSVLIVYVTFGFTRFRTFIQTIFMFYFVTFMVGGGLLGIHFFLQTNDFVNSVASTKVISFGDPVSWLFVLLGCPIVYYFSKKRVEDIEVTKIRYEQIIKVDIVIGKAEVQLNGLIDSGNQLYDPLTKTPVMIVDVNCTNELFPDWLIEQSKSLTQLPDGGEKDSQWMTRLRIVPYRGVGQSGRFLLAVKPDAIRIYHGEEVLTVQRVLIGLNHTKLSADHEYDCILHPKMFVSTNMFTA
ncbi:sigma-E processing peptidase SpoIIGA [Microbacteriaceae bacterium 4G12]